MSDETKRSAHFVVGAKSPVVREDTQKSQKALLQDANNVNDDDYTSSSGSSTDDDDDDNDDDDRKEDNDGGQEQGPVSLNAMLRTSAIGKPSINNDLKARLAAFLPRLQEANQTLKDAGDAPDRQIDAVDDDEQHYVEMDLSLGVLTERRPDDDGIRTRMSEDDDDEPSTVADENEAANRNSQGADARVQRGKVQEL